MNKHPNLLTFDVLMFQTNQEDMYSAFKRTVSTSSIDSASYPQVFSWRIVIMWQVSQYYFNDNWL